MRALRYIFIITSIAILGISKPVSAEMGQEFFLHTGFYAADRFQNSLNLGAGYDFHFSKRFSMGAAIGIARAGQEFIQKVLSAAPEQGSSTVVYYNGRIMYNQPIGKIVPYALVGLGVTRQHSEANLTVSMGLGTKFPIGRTTYIRYEINNHFFSSGKDNTAWTNNNLEVAIGVSFFLK